MDWYCTPCDERHEVGDMCPYWDQEPDQDNDPHRDMENFYDFQDET